MGNDWYVTISRAAFIALLLLNVVLWSRGSYGQVHHGNALQLPGHKFSKRSVPGLLESKQCSTYEEGGSEVRGYLLTGQLRLHSQSVLVSSYSYSCRAPMQGRARLVSYIRHVSRHPVPESLFLC